MRHGGPDDEDPPPAGRGDVRLTREERNMLMDFVAGMARERAPALRLLDRIGFPPHAIPAWPAAVSPADWWSDVFQQIDLGAGENPYRTLIMDLHRTYRRHPDLRELFDRHVRPTAAPALPGRDALAGSVRVIVRATTEDEIAEAEAELRALGLEPVAHLYAEHAVGYTVNSTDAQDVQRRLRDTPLGWTVVPPGGPDYVIRNIDVVLPDGSRRRAIDVAAAQRVGEFTSDILASTQQAGEGATSAPISAVLDRIDASGQRHRQNPAETLDQAGIHDGSQVRLGTEARAGAVHPQTHEDALHRAFHQIRGYAEAHGMRFWVNSPNLPHLYVLEFDQDSVGPPPAPGADPVTVRHHRVRVEFGPGFPESRPNVTWESPIFHPNVFPNDDSDLARQHPAHRGHVCLGQLDHGWYPALDLAELCQMLVDIAAFRNYDLFALAQEGDEVRERVNFLDGRAAAWVLSHQEVIAAVGGVQLRRPGALSGDVGESIRPRVARNVLHRLD